MFKSVFVKYISAFMLIHFLSILLSTAVITSLVNVYDENNKNRTIGNVAYNVSDYIVKDYFESGQVAFNDYLNNSVVLLKPVLDAMVASMDDVEIFVADGEGNVKLAGGSERWRESGSLDGLHYPAEITDRLTASGKIILSGAMDGLFEDKRRI